MPINQGRPAGILTADGQQWRILEVRDWWMDPSAAAVSAGREAQRWLLLVEGPPLFDAGESAVREVIVSSFTEDGAWWMDVS